MKCLLIHVVAGLIFSLPAAARSAEEIPSQKTLATVPELVLQMGHFGGVWSVAFSPDGKQVLTGGTDDTAILWDAATATVLRRFEGHKGYFKTVSFSRDGKSILTGSNDDTAILWNAVTGEKLRAFQGGDGSVALSPDGRLVLMGSREKTATLWDTATGKMSAASREIQSLADVALRQPKTRVPLYGGALLRRNRPLRPLRSPRMASEC